MSRHASAGGQVPPRPSAFDALLLFGLVLLLALLAGPVLRIPLQIPVNYNEGWNAGFDTRAVLPGAGPLYPGPDTLVFNNYPPLGFLLVGAAGRFLFGDMIVAGRVIALLSLLCCALLVRLCVARLGGPPRAAWASALLLLLLTATFFRGYVAMDDPQWLAHAVMLAGLAVLLGGAGPAALRSGALPWARIVAACLLMVAGGFVKHNLVALPLATTLFLCWLRPRAGLLWIAAAVAALALGGALMAITYGAASFHDILHHRRLFRVHLLTHAISRLAPLLPAVLLSGRMLRRRRCGDGAVLAGLFIVIALATGTLQRMGEGVYYNAHFEAMIAACLGTGLALGAASRSTGRRTGSASAPAPLLLFALLPVLGALPWHLPIAWHAVADRYREERAWQPVIGRLRAAPGDVGCHLLSLCYWAGKPFEMDLFNLTQSVAAGGPIDRFDALADGRVLALFEDDPTSFLHSDAVRKLGRDPLMDRLHRHYAVVARGPGAVVLLAPTGR